MKYKDLIKHYFMTSSGKIIKFKCGLGDLPIDGVNKIILFKR